MRRTALPALLILAACAAPPPPMPGEEATRLRQIFAAWQDQPFDTGPVSIVAEEHGEMHTYTLAPCRGGETVCAGSAHGHAGHIHVTADHAVVTRLYGRTFYLSPGGDGWLVGPHGTTPLAWDDESPISQIAVTRITDQGQGLEATTH